MVYRLEDYSLSELKGFAKTHKKTMKGFSGLKKADLIKGLREKLDVIEEEGKKIKIKVRKAEVAKAESAPAESAPAELPKGPIKVSLKKLASEVGKKVKVKKTTKGIEIEKKDGAILDIELDRAKKYFTEANVFRDGEKLIIVKN